MGFGSFIGKIGKVLESPFRTGRSSAAAAAQDAMNQQGEMANDFYELMTPSVEMGQGFLEQYGGYASPEGLEGLYTGLQDSGLVQSMMDDRMRATESYISASGQRGSGNALKAAAEVPTGVLSGLMDKILGLTQNSASIGLGQGGTVLGALNSGMNAANTAGQYGMTPGNNKASMFGGLLSLGGQLGSAAIMSDARLKKDIRKIGEIGRLNVYEWEWIDDSIGGVMKTGFIAQEVQKEFPQHVHPFEIDGFELLAVDYDSVLKEAA
jgi:hypothetical protein